MVAPPPASPPEASPGQQRALGPPRRLDLTIPDVRRYIDPAVPAAPPVDELEEIIVNGLRPEPLPEHRALPRGVLPSLFYAARNPLSAWRIFVPDPHYVIPERDPDDLKPPPGAFRGQILEPGQIYD